MRMLICRWRRNGLESWLSLLGDDDGRASASLSDWLRREEGPRGRIRLVRQEPRKDEMGTALDLLSVAVGNGELLTVLAGSLRVWLKQPRSRAADQTAVHFVIHSTLFADQASFIADSSRLVTHRGRFQPIARRSGVRFGKRCGDERTRAR